jgi:DNA-binding NarL/FixJ family response regulator
VIADDHRLVAEALEQLLADDCDVVGTVYDGEALLKEIGRSHPDLVVQDLSMPPLNGVDLIREVLMIDPTIQVIVVTMVDDVNMAAEAFRAGASSYVLKNCAVTELQEAVACAGERKSYVTPLIASSVVQALTKRRPNEESGPELTNRQLDVLRLLAEGKSMKEAAAILHVTARTVAFHKYHMMRQLNIRTSAELVRFAVLRRLA